MKDTVHVNDEKRLRYRIFDGLEIKFGPKAETVTIKKEGRDVKTLALKK